MARTSRRLPFLAAIALPFLAAIAPTASAHSYGKQTGSFADKTKLHDTIVGYAGKHVDIDEMAMTPTGQWIIVSGSQITTSNAFPADCLTKVKEYVKLGLEIDCIAFAPNGGWMVIAEHLAWHSAGLSYVSTLESKIFERIKAGQRLTELVFDSDGSGWSLISGNWAHTVSMPSDLYAAIIERHQSKRMIRQISMAPDGRWVLLADDWYASHNLVQTCVNWLRKFQQEQRTMDRIMLGQNGNWVLYSHGAFTPNMNDPMQAIEYGLSENIWQRMADEKVAGISIALIENNKVKMSRTYGELEAGTQRFMRASTPIDAASLSKFATSMTLMSLVDDGILSLDTSAVNAAITGYFKHGFTYWNPLLIWLLYGSSYANGIPMPGDGVTLRRCLSHSASLEPYSTTAYLPGDALPNTLQMLFGHNSNGAVESYGGGNMVWYDPNILEDGKTYQPGDVYRYSAGGYMVAQAMAETLTLSSLESLAANRIFSPLGMSDTTFFQPLSADFAARAAVPHDSSGNPKAVNQRPIYPWASGGGLYTSPRDLAQAVITLMKVGVSPAGQKILEPASAQEMMTKQAAGSTKYGLGLSLSSTKVTTTNGAWFAHNGSHPGAKTQLAGNPAKQNGIVIMINTGGDDASALRGEIYARFKSVYGW